MAGSVACLKEQLILDQFELQLDKTIKRTQRLLLVRKTLTRSPFHSERMEKVS